MMDNIICALVEHCHITSGVFLAAGTFGLWWPYVQLLVQGALPFEGGDLRPEDHLTFSSQPVKAY
jgi:hypothetical protein